MVHALHDLELCATFVPYPLWTSQSSSKCLEVIGGAVEGGFVCEEVQIPFMLMLLMLLFGGVNNGVGLGSIS